eukprot:scaffold61549_cov45-Phaeocystis_antarctica.AAC.2
MSTPVRERPQSWYSKFCGEQGPIAERREACAEIHGGNSCSLSVGCLLPFDCVVRARTTPPSQLRAWLASRCTSAPTWATSPWSSIRATRHALARISLSCAPTPAPNAICPAAYHLPGRHRTH